MSEILCVKLQYVCSESVEWMLKYPHAYKESVSSTLSCENEKKSLHILIFSFITLSENEHCYFLIKNVFSFLKKMYL